MRSALASCLIVLAAFAGACGDDDGPTDASVVHDGSAVVDAAMRDLAGIAVDGGVLAHRTDDTQCATPVPAGSCPLMSGAAPCTTDAECTAGTEGRCIEQAGGALTCACTYQTCTHDTDCATDQLCVCHGSAYASGADNTCLPGNCRTDADCAGSYCSPSHGTTCAQGVSGYYCHVAADECLLDADCGVYRVCAWSSTAAHWTCQTSPLCP